MTGTRESASESLYTSTFDSRSTRRQINARPQNPATAANCRLLEQFAEVSMAVCQVVIMHRQQLYPRDTWAARGSVASHFSLTQNKGKLNLKFQTVIISVFL